MSGHTPGPWVAHQYGVRDVGGYICRLNWPTHYSGQDERFSKETAERQADARLMAAAPDLLKAAIKANELLELIAHINPADVPQEGSVGQLLRDAIAKATQP